MRHFLSGLIALALVGTAWANCGSPYFPVQQGWVWTYRSSVDNQTYTQTHSNVTANGFTNVMRLESGTIQARWRCDAGGVVALEQNSVNFSGAPEGFKVETSNVRGVQVPNRMAVGATWSFSYIAKARMPQGSMNSTVEVSNKVVGQESVRVAAGSFTAFKVQSTMVMKMTMNVSGQSRSMPANTINSTSWYAQGVGLVKSVAGEITTELVSLKK
jgi:hypothetical protein